MMTSKSILVSALLLCFGGGVSLFAQGGPRNVSNDIQTLQYLMDDEAYDAVILKANQSLLQGDVSYEDEGMIISYITEALFHKGQYGEFSQDFEEFAKGFPEAKRLSYLYFLEMQSRNFRRHYYEALEAGDMGIRTATVGDHKVVNKVLKEAAMILQNDILDNQLYTLYDDVTKEMKVPIVQAMLDRGLDPPVDSSLLIPEYDDVWQNRATSHFFRGSILAGPAFPFIGINNSYYESPVDKDAVFPEVGNALAIDFTGTYRLLNGIGLGGHLSFAQWSSTTNENIPGFEDTSGTVPDPITFEDQSMVISGYGVVRFYLPKIRKKYQMFIEPGAGVAYFTHWTPASDGDVVFTAKGDLGFTFARTFEIRASYKMLQAPGFDKTTYTKDPYITETYQWIGASIGMVLRKYSSKSKQKKSTEELTEATDISKKEVVEETPEVVDVAPDEDATPDEAVWVKPESKSKKK